MPKTIKKVASKAVFNEQVITDVLEEYFIDEDGNPKVKKIYMNGKKKVKTEIEND